MSQSIVQAQCPGCRYVLRIPAAWAQQSVRCKQCGRIFQMQLRPAVPEAVRPNAAVARAAATAAPPRAIPVPVPAPGPPIHLPEVANVDIVAKRARLQRIRTIVQLSLAGAVLAAVFIVWLAVDWQKVLTAMMAPDDSPSVDKKGVVAGKDGTRPTELSQPVDSADYPRRLLAISVNNYLYANPVNYGGRGNGREGRTHALVEALADYLHIHRSQTVFLSDGAPNALPPVQSVIENTITDFLNGCRAQDRIIVLFAGHAIEIEEVPYLVPLEGELDSKEHLIPVAWLLERLAKCKARQKVLLLDVCRFDPTRGQERPDSGPMGEKLDAMIKSPPEGVQVLTTCVAGQYSYEFDNGTIVGGLALTQLARMTLVGRPMQRPEDPLPLQKMADAISALTRADVQTARKAEQTIRLTGIEAPGGAPYNRGEPLPPVLVVRAPALLDGGPASDAEVRSILQQIEVPPSKKSREDAFRLRVETTPRFAAKALAPYRDDSDTPLRRAVLKTVAVLRNDKVSRAFPDEFLVPNGDEAAFKQKILQLQKSPDGPARAQLQLMEALEELRQAGEERDKEPSKRWQANYDYILARLLTRLAYVNEHNYALGQLRRELPPRDRAIHNGWRLASQEKLESGKDARDQARDAQALLLKLVKEHPGTPWALLAKRERVTALGLRWEPIGFAVQRQ
jgi:hypothetical protein